MKLNSIRAVVIHGDGGAVKHGNIDGLMRWMRDERKEGAFYHYFVAGTTIVAGAAESDMAIHCGNNTYTMKATQYFGSVFCPPWDHRDQAHVSSPNHCTLGICMLHDYEDGRYSDETLRTGAKLAAGRLGAYGLDIEGLWDHTMIVGRETKLCPRAFYVEESQKDAFWKMTELEIEAIEAMYNRMPR